MICSKSDDITVTEALKTLPEANDAHQLYERQLQLEQECVSLQAELDQLKAESVEQRESIEDQLQEMDNLRSAIRRSKDEDATLLLVSPRSSRKRPHRAAASQARKKLRLGDDSGTEETDSDEDEESESSESEMEEEEISRETAVKRCDELEVQNSALRARDKELKLQLKSQLKKLKQAKGELKSLRSQIKRECIRFRNEYARPSIQGQFAEGIRE